MEKEKIKELEEYCKKIHTTQAIQKTVRSYDEFVESPTVITSKIICEKVGKDKQKEEAKRLYYECLEYMQYVQNKNNIKAAIIFIAIAVILLIPGVTAESEIIKAICTTGTVIFAAIGTWNIRDNSSKWIKWHLDDLYEATRILMTFGKAL